MDEKMICCRCNVEMEEREVRFDYLGKSFSANTLQCPVCGQVYLSAELVKNKVNQVEMMLEEK